MKKECNLKSCNFANPSRFYPLPALTINKILDEKSLSHHIANTPLGIIIFNDKKEVLYWSDQATRIFKWNEKDLLLATPAEINLIYEEDIAQVYEKIEAIISGETLSN